MKRIYRKPIVLLSYIFHSENVVLDILSAFKNHALEYACQRFGVDISDSLWSVDSDLNKREYELLISEYGN